MISTGHYALARHPAYFGAACYCIGTVLLLGSWGVIFAFVLIGVLCIPIEEKAQRAGLVGYDEYTGLAMRPKIYEGLLERRWPTPSKSS